LPSESHIQAAIRLALGGRDVVLWRNETGAAVPCRLEELKAARKDPKVLERLIARGLVSYGLCKGSSDLIGIRRDGRFVAIEVKAERGRLRPEQERFLGLVDAYGGLAGVARSVDEARRIIEL